MLIDQVYYINVDSFEDRRKYMEEQFARELILAERFSAFHPTTTNIVDLMDSKLIAESALCNVTGNIMHKEELINLYSKAFEDENARSQIFTLFTAASHGAIWREVSLMPENSVALVLEDDVMFLVKDFWETIQLHSDHLPEDYDIAFFAYWELCATPINDFFSVPNKNKEKCNLWTNCYIISQKGAKKLFDMFFPYSKTSGIDVDMRERYDEFNVYFSNVEFATQRRDRLYEAGHPVFTSAREVFMQNKHKIKRPLPKNFIVPSIAPGKKNYIASSLFTTCEDPGDAVKRARDKINYKAADVMHTWYTSGLEICEQYPDVQMIVFYDQIHPEIFKKYNSNHIDFIQVDDCALSNPYEYRWVVYKRFLEKNLGAVENIFFTDIGDVTIKQNPFLAIDKTVLYTGYQKEPWHKKWLKTRTMYYIHHISDLKQVYDKWRSHNVLNAGVLGGEANIVLNFLNKMVEHIENTVDLQVETDMIMFNYVLRKYFPNVKYDSPVTSVFWGFQNWRNDVWFIHK